MDAAQALDDLTEISSQIEAAVLVDRAGTILASTLDDPERAERVGRAVAALLEQAEGARSGATLVQLEAATHDGSVFVVRDGERTIAAVTKPEPTVGLVFYDLKSALRNVQQGGDNGT